MNSGSVTISGKSVAAFEGLLCSVGIDQVDASDGTTDLATYEIKVKKGGWKDVLLDVGFTAVDSSMASGYKPITIWDPDQLGFVTPSHGWPLNSDGTKKSDLPPNTIEFEPYVESAWTGVPLS